MHKHYLNLLTYNEMQSHLFRKTRLTADVERMAGVEPAENQFMRIKRRECGDARAGRRFFISRTHNTHYLQAQTRPHPLYRFRHNKLFRLSKNSSERDCARPLRLFKVSPEGEDYTTFLKNYIFCESIGSRTTIEVI